MNNLLYEVKYAVETHFKFLQDNYNFTPFEQVSLAYEYHFKANDSAGNFINIHIELIASTPIWVNFNGVYIENLITDNLVDKYNIELHNLYDSNFNKYLKTKDTKYISANIDNYNLYGNTINNNRLQRIAELIKEDFYKLVSASKKYKDLKEEEAVKQNQQINSNTLKEFALLANSQEFKEKFISNNVLIVDTDKCQIDITSIKELKSLINTLTKNKNNVVIDCHFVN
ncbi:MAG: hypothetical protein ABJD66_00090 [Cellulophaga sp.]|uniref:hypothetical protein n=1 Tax=Cellulophaga sp. TaxID=1972202 RepID=UPI0032649D10